ncbi:MAG: DNA polymerase III, partial [Acidobacteriota bacterium]|nr:DNA polymerase III [Acidobacteriota bacterium]
HRVGRHLIGETHAVASELADYLLDGAPRVTVFPVGSLRRGCETCGDVDLLAVGANDALMTRFTSFPGVDRILAHGTTKSSILLHNTVQADLRLVAPESTGAAAQYFTGSKSHNIALRDLALQRGLKLNEYGLFRESDDRRLAGDTESEIYETLGLAYVPPELREHRGELFAAASGDLPALIERADLKGDLHCHTTATDGKADVETMAHARHVRDIDARVDGVALLAGIECDILADGTLDPSEDCLAELDLVVASVHSAFEQDEFQMTDRLLRAIESPVVDVMGHLTGRLLLRREPYRLRHDTVFDAAARLGVALEINSQTHRLDLSDIHARMARERGVKLVITTDAHAPSDFDLLHWGILVARRAWASPADVMNTQSLVELRASLRRHQP